MPRISLGAHKIFLMVVPARELELGVSGQEWEEVFVFNVQLALEQCGLNCVGSFTTQIFFSVSTVQHYKMYFFFLRIFLTFLQLHCKNIDIYTIQSMLIDCVISMASSQQKALSFWGVILTCGFSTVSGNQWPITPILFKGQFYISPPFFLWKFI